MTVSTDIDKGYDELDEWQQRVVQEHNELWDKYVKITRFIESPSFDNIGAGEQQDLRAQRQTMQVYISILDSRIARFA